MNTNSLTCKICFKLYDQNISPRLLPCGHTCCTPCLTKILKDNYNRCCHMCRESLSNTNAGDYKINYALMEICEEFSNSPWSIEALRRRLEVLSKEHKIVLSSAKEIANIVMGNMSKISLMESNENEMLEFIGKEDEEINGKKVHEALDAIEKLMIEVDALFPPRKRRNLSSSTSYNMLDFPDNSQFLTKIYNEVGKGQKIESLLLINETRKASRISICDNILLVHAFRPSSEARLAKNVEFSDLKKCLLQQQLYAFLNLTYTEAGVCHRIFIKNFTQSILISKFLKLCTGESGPSYLDSTFSLRGSESEEEEAVLSSNSYNGHCKVPRYNNLHIINNEQSPFLNIVGDELPQKLDWEEQYHGYIAKIGIEKPLLDTANHYLSLGTNGTFRIHSPQKKVLQNLTVIGSVFGDTSKLVQKFNNTVKGVVADCGIAVML